MTWGGEGARGGNCKPSARDSQEGLRLRIEARAGAKPGAHDRKVDNPRLTLLTPSPLFPPVHARWRFSPVRLEDKSVCVWICRATCTEKYELEIAPWVDQGTLGGGALEG